MKKQLAALCLAWTLPVSALAVDALEQAESLLAAGRADEAHALLQPLEAGRIGDPAFDYRWGLVLLARGQPGQASLAFERVLARDPRHAGAWLDSARAWLALGDLVRASTALDTAERLAPPPAARAMIAAQRAAIEARRQGGGLRLRAHAELGLGRDSNVTVGPRASTLYLPAFGSEFALGALTRATADAYGHVALGGEARQGWSGQRALVASADLRWRDQRRVDGYDAASGDLRAAYEWQHGGAGWRVSAGHHQHRLDDSRYRRVESLGAEWRRPLGAHGAQVSVFGQQALVRHAEALRDSDVDQSLLGAGWATPLGAEGRTVLLAAAYAGFEAARHARLDGDRRFAGVRVGAQHGFGDQLELYALASVQGGRYSQVNALFEARRNDAQIDLTVGATWRFAPAWSLRPQVSWTRNESSLAINDYRRYDAGLFVRREFE